MQLESIPYFSGYNSMKIFIVFGDCLCGKKAVPLHPISKVQNSTKATKSNKGYKIRQ